MTTFTAAKDALLIAIYEQVLRPSSDNYIKLLTAGTVVAIAAQSTAEPKLVTCHKCGKRIDGACCFDALGALCGDCWRPTGEPKPSTAYGKLGGCWRMGGEEPKPNAGVITDGAVELISERLGLTCSVVRQVAEAAALFICSAKERDTATVIADNDEKMLVIERLKFDLIGWQRIAAERSKEIIRLLHPDIDAAAERARHAYSIASRPVAWKAIARAVYGLTSEGG